jgi:hypothetical protein
MCFVIKPLTLNLLKTTIVAPPSNASKWQMGFNSAFKGLMTILSFLSVLLIETKKYSNRDDYQKATDWFASRRFKLHFFTLLFLLFIGESTDLPCLVQQFLFLR